jgi:hypothetical protein
MKIDLPKLLLLACALACAALPAEAADRMKAGQWVGTWTGGGRTRPTSSCMTQSDVDALNGDAKSVRAYLEKVVPPTICKVTNIKVDGGRIDYTSVCSGKENAITTTYHGDRFESLDSSGSKSEAKWVGACK